MCRNWFIMIRIGCLLLIGLLIMVGGFDFNVCLMRCVVWVVGLRGC